MTAKNIVFDMGGVLFKRSTWSVLWHLKGSVVGYLCLEWGSEKTLKLKFFECMARNIPYPKNIKPAPITEFGQPIPYPLYEHFLGSRDSLDILKDVKAAIDKDSTISKENPSPFLSPRESYLLKKSAEIIFDPKIFIKTNKAISDGINIFKDCYYQGHNVYIISCWGDQAFDLLESQYPDIFGRCKGHIISAKVHLVKPDPKIYHKLLDDFHLDPTETFFIDDHFHVY